MPANAPGSNRRLLLSLSALSACLSAGYGVLFTVVADYRDSYGISETAIGWIIGIGFLAGFVSQMTIAPIGDRGHARRLVLAGVAVNAVGLLMMGFGQDLATILAGRIVSGLAIGAANPAIRRIIVLSDRDNLGRNLGRLLSADVFGFALGPAVSAVLVGPFGLAAPFIAIATASVAVLALTFNAEVEEDSDPNKRRLAIDLLTIKPFAGAVVLGATAFLMIGTFDALWDVVHSDLGTADWLANLGISLFAIPLIILGPFGGRMAQEIGPFRLGAAGLLIAAAFMGSYGLLPSGGWIFTVSMFHAVTDGITIATSGVAVAMTVPPDRQAGAQGVLGAAQALAAGAMAGVAGGLYESTSRATVYLVTAGIMVAMVVCGMALAYSVWIVDPKLRTRRPSRSSG